MFIHFPVKYTFYFFSFGHYMWSYYVYSDAIFWWTCFIFCPLGKYLGVGFLSHTVNISLTLSETAKLFSKVTFMRFHPYIPSSSTWGSQLLCIHLWLPCPCSHLSLTSLSTWATEGCSGPWVTCCLAFLRPAPTNSVQNRIKWNPGKRRGAGEFCTDGGVAWGNQYDLTHPTVYYNIAAWTLGSCGHLLQSSGKAFYQIHSGKWYKLLDFFSNIKNSYFQPFEAG